MMVEALARRAIEGTGEMRPALTSAQFDIFCALLAQAHFASDGRAAIVRRDLR
jgi:hypothetical protein